MKLFLLKEENILLREVYCTPINTVFALCWPGSVGSQDLARLALASILF